MKHGETSDVLPVEALTQPDFYLWLTRVPMTNVPDGNCQYDACASDEVCNCQEHFDRGKVPR